MAPLGVLFTIILFSLGVPIAFIMGLIGFGYLSLKGDSNFLFMIPQQLYVGVDTFLLIAVPFFILAGNLMNTGGVSRRLVGFANSLVGHISGGLGHSSVVASMFFGGVTGASTADLAAIGSVSIPAMVKQGYDKDFAAAVTASASTTGAIIPPSIAMVLYGMITGTSIGRLFLGGFIPGALIGLAQMVIVYIYAKKRHYPKGQRASALQIFKSFRDAIWALAMPFIILGGIVLGIFGPTEASVAGAIYALVVGLFIYKELKWPDLPKIFFQSGLMSGGVMLIIGMSNILKKIFATEMVPQRFTEWIVSVSAGNPILILLLINLMVFILGCLVDTSANVMLATPVLLPLALSIGLDPVHFGLIVVVNAVIGVITPPVGLCLFLAASLAKLPFAQVARACMPFLAVSVGVLLLISFVPDIVLLLPRIFMP